MTHSMCLTGSKREVETTPCIFGATPWALGKSSQHDVAFRGAGLHGVTFQAGLSEVPWWLLEPVPPLVPISLVSRPHCGDRG